MILILVKSYLMNHKSMRIIIMIQAAQLMNWRIYGGTCQLNWPALRYPIAHFTANNVRVYLVGYIFCIIDYHICRDIFGRLYILYNRLPYMSGYIW
jgi:hypothetical protein